MTTRRTFLVVGLAGGAALTAAWWLRGRPGQDAWPEAFAPLASLDAAAALTPGLESPTISPLKDREWVAVRAMVPKLDTNQVMDALYEVGARAILVSSIHAARI